MKKNDLLLRSLMFVPAHNDRLLNNAKTCDADVLLLDLEDSVQPVENKAIARQKIKSMMGAGEFDRYHVFPRVNDRESGYLLQDVQELATCGITGFVYPKAHTGQDIYFFDKLLETVEYERKLPIGSLKIIPLIETAAAVLNAQEICQASSRVVAIAFGCEDFVTDLQGIHDAAGLSIYTARAMIAMAARANNVIPIDTVHIKVHDLDDLEKNLGLAKDLGFEGMLILHPKEIPFAHRYFSPTDAELEQAAEMLQLSEEAEKEGRGVAYINGKFVGPPMVMSAKKVLEKGKLIAERVNARSKT